MSTTKKTLYAAIGAGTTAISKARELPQRVVTLPTTLSERVNGLRTIDIRELPGTVRSSIKAVPVRASGLVEEAKKFTDKATERFIATYTEFSKRGETFARKVQRAAPTRRAVEQTKAARSKVKAAATSVKKATGADVEAVKAAAAKTAEQLG